jgi:hypothetical protein
MMMPHPRIHPFRGARVVQGNDVNPFALCRHHPTHPGFYNIAREDHPQRSNLAS